jgi:hypothetical protein
LLYKRTWWGHDVNQSEARELPKTSLVGSSYIGVIDDCHNSPLVQQGSLDLADNTSHVLEEKKD